MTTTAPPPPPSSESEADKIDGSTAKPRRRNSDRFGDGISQERRTPNFIYKAALMHGATYSAIFGVPITAAVLLANRVSPSFRSRLGMSGKLATCVMGFMFPFVLNAEFKTLELSRESAGMSRRQVELARREMEAAAIAAGLAKERKESLTLTGKAVDFLVEHPFKVFFAFSIPTVTGILAHNLRQTHLKISHRLVHTRVQGQAATLAILGTTMILNQVCSKSRGKHARGRSEERGYSGYDAAAGHATWRTDEWRARQEKKREELYQKRAEMLAKNQAAVRRAAE
jgi:hypothetical protein